MARISEDMDRLLETSEFSILNDNLIATKDERQEIQELEKLADAARQAMVNKRITKQK